MAERFAKVNQGVVSQRNTKNTVFVYIIKQLYYSLSSYMNSYIMIGSVSFVLELDIYIYIVLTPLEVYWLPTLGLTRPYSYTR